MSTSKRQQIMRHLDNADSNIDRAVDALAKASLSYVESHPDIVSKYKVLVQYLDAAKPIISQLRDV